MNTIESSGVARGTHSIGRTDGSNRIRTNHGPRDRRIQFVRLESAAERVEAREFLNANPSDNKAWPIPPQHVDRRLGVPSIIRAAHDSNGRLVAVGFASNNPEDVRRGKQLRWPSDRIRVLATEMLKLHSVTVAPHCRGNGIGLGLVNQLLLDGANIGATIATAAFDDETPGLASFYHQARFHLLDRGERLNLGFSRLAGDVLAFQHDDPRHRWGVRIIRPDRVALFQQLERPRR